MRKGAGLEGRAGSPIQSAKLIATLLGSSQGQSWEFRRTTMVVPEIPTWLAWKARGMAHSRSSGIVPWVTKWTFEHWSSTTRAPNGLKYMQEPQTQQASVEGDASCHHHLCPQISAKDPGASSPGLRLIFFFLTKGLGSQKTLIPHTLPPKGPVGPFNWPKISAFICWSLPEMLFPQLSAWLAPCSSHLSLNILSSSGP